MDKHTASSALSVKFAGENIINIREIRVSVGNFLIPIQGSTNLKETKGLIIMSTFF
jgi:hypothetical protein